MNCVSNHLVSQRVIVLSNINIVFFMVFWFFTCDWFNHRAKFAFSVSSSILVVAVVKLILIWPMIVWIVWNVHAAITTTVQNVVFDALVIGSRSFSSVDFVFSCFNITEIAIKLGSLFFVSVNSRAQVNRALWHWRLLLFVWWIVDRWVSSSLWRVSF